MRWLKQDERFVVISHWVNPNTLRYRVRDMTNGKFVRFSYSNPPLYESEFQQASNWQSYLAALGFCRKLASKNNSHN